MRRTDKQITDPALIDKILKEEVICRLAFQDEDYPYLVPVNFGYAENALYIHCATKGKKLDLLRKNNKVCFEIEGHYEIVTGPESCNWTTKYRSVIGFGTAEIITDTTAKMKGLDVIMVQHGKTENTYDEKLLDRMLVLKVHIEKLTAKQSGDWSG